MRAGSDDRPQHRRVRRRLSRRRVLTRRRAGARGRARAADAADARAAPCSRCRCPSRTCCRSLGRRLSSPPSTRPPRASSPVRSTPSSRVEALLTERGVTSRRLQTSHAFHSAMMDPILPAFTKCVERVEHGEPRIPFISNLTGSWITDDEATRPEYWAEHLRGAVRFSQGVRHLVERSGAGGVGGGSGQHARHSCPAAQSSVETVHDRQHAAAPQGRSPRSTVRLERRRQRVAGRRDRRLDRSAHRRDPASDSIADVSLRAPALLGGGGRSLHAGHGSGTRQFDEQAGSLALVLSAVVAPLHAGGPRGRSRVSRVGRVMARLHRSGRYRRPRRAGAEGCWTDGRDGRRSVGRGRLHDRSRARARTTTRSSERSPRARRRRRTFCICGVCPRKTTVHRPRNESSSPRIAGFTACCFWRRRSGARTSSTL